MQDLLFFHWHKHNICIHQWKKFIHPPENPIVFQIQLMIFLSGLVEPSWLMFSIQAMTDQETGGVYKSADKLRSTLF